MDTRVRWKVQSWAQDLVLPLAAVLIFLTSQVRSGKWHVAVSYLRTFMQTLFVGGNVLQRLYIRQYSSGLI